MTGDGFVLHIYMVDLGTMGTWGWFLRCRVSQISWIPVRCRTVRCEEFHARLGMV
jgi:formate dehydrogenase maturation protein FdhE